MINIDYPTINQPVQTRTLGPSFDSLSLRTLRRAAEPGRPEGPNGPPEAGMWVACGLYVGYLWVVYGILYRYIYIYI